MSSDADNESTPFIQPNTVRGTLIVATVLCLVCSLLVSATAVFLRPRIARNKELKKQRNVLIAAGLFDESQHTDADIERLFADIDTVLVVLPRSDGTAEAGAINTELDLEQYDSRKAAKDPKQQVSIPPEMDTAGIKHREPSAPVYLIKGDDGTLQQIVLPVYGKGLWSTLYGFLALDADPQQGLPVTGITFYEHAETPGLGGEVDNPKWKAQWPGKELFTAEGQPRLIVTKPDNASAVNEIDGISGATITSNGVEGLVNYWLGPDGFGPFLQRYRSGEFKVSGRTGNERNRVSMTNNRQRAVLGLRGVKDPANPQSLLSADRVTAGIE